ncbi:MAG TPA: DUF4296 domain-containing protein [Mucilaginibacter sp.]|jgi:hypothetical protein|nr:DUF4296 domain-containing protein [Mucilaginibacter sp.]
MLKYITLFFSVSVFLSACSANKAPANVISPNRMASLLTEVHLIDGRLYLVKQEPDSLYKYGTGRYVALFKKYHTDSVQFRKSMDYYAAQPLELQKMYDQIGLNLKQKTDSLNKLQIKQNALSK